MTRADRADAPVDRRRRLLVLGICSLSLFITYLDTTILNVALPAMARDLGAKLSDLQWVVDAYLLVLTSLLLLSGSIGDRIGRRRVFTVGLVAFSAGSLLCSLAPNVDTLIAFRALQAVGGCMLTPVSLSIVRTTFTDAGERARALGLWSGVFGLATACGPILGGVLVSYVGWRSVFWVNVPVGLGAFVLARRFIPESRASHARRVDLPGQGLIIVVLASLTYAIIEAPIAGWTSPLIVGLFMVTVVALAAFVIVESRRDEPLLEVRFFRSPPFAGAIMIAALAFTVFSGFLFVNTLYLQDVRGESAFRAGLSMLPATVLIALSAPLAGRIVARRGPRWPLAVAGLLLATGMGLLLTVTPSTPYAALAVAYVLLGLGFGLVNPPLTNTAITSMPPAQAGVASAVASAARQFGNVLGVALMGTLLTVRFRASLALKLAPLGLSSATRSALAHTTVGASGAALPVGARHNAAVLSALRSALALATHGPWLLGMGCGLACTVVALGITRARARAAATAVYSDVDGDATPAAADTSGRSFSA